MGEETGQTCWVACFEVPGLGFIRGIGDGFDGGKEAGCGLHDEDVEPAKVRKILPTGQLVRFCTHVMMFSRYRWYR